MSLTDIYRLFDYWPSGQWFFDRRIGNLKVGVDIAVAVGTTIPANKVVILNSLFALFAGPHRGWFLKQDVSIIPFDSQS
jgi:hypothetical protein